ncbi:DUF1294 domain-containing protein [Agrobacterium tumefaciens]|nr:DUF1294 domain-containing protein [Agrobacterium tumefaciens]
MTMIALCLTIYIAFNLFVFLVYWRDKRAARNSEWRVRESTLLWLAFAGGEPFRSILISIIVVQVGLVASLVIMPDWPMRLVNGLGALSQNSVP